MILSVAYTIVTIKPNLTTYAFYGRMLYINEMAHYSSQFSFIMKVDLKSH